MGKLKEIREELARAGAPYVETVAVMTKCNPFAEKAGMARVIFQTRGLTRPAENRLRSHFLELMGTKERAQRARVTRISEMEFLLTFGSHQRGNEV